MSDPEDEPNTIQYDSDETYGGDGYVWPYKAPPRQWDHTLNGYPPGPGRPKGTKRADLSGQVFEHLTVVERIEDHVTPSGGKHPNYRCQCVCGKSVDALGTNLKAGRTKSCGCQAADLRAAWREEEMELHRQHVRQSCERYEAWKVSEERAEQERQLHMAARSRDGLS